MALPILSDLQFNASDVATAVANKVQIANTNIGTLAQGASDDRDDIADLLTQAQADAQTLQNLITANTVTHYTFAQMNITATSPWVFSSTADHFAFEFNDIVWFQLAGNDGDQVTGNVAANYQIGNIGNTNLRPSVDRKVSAVSMEFQGETNSYFNIYANGNIELLYPKEDGDSTHRFLMQGFYKL